VQLHREREGFEAAGVRLAVVGQGTPAMARDFQRGLHVDLPVLLDRRRDAYRAAGAKIATAGELLGPRVMARGVRRALAAGVRQGALAGDAAQLGGVLVVATDGSIPYAHLSQDASDTPAVEEVLAAARAAGRRRRGR
jgi:AhpC/TSA antioxidant enzyme